MSVLTQHSRALILPGGGARAAYQVGVLKAIAELLPKQHYSPFKIFSGTSAGAINAAVLASNAMHYQVGMQHLENVWKNFTVDQVFKTDTWTVMRNTAHWVFTVLSAGRFRSKPTSVLDNAPLRDLLTKHVKMERVDKALKEKIIDGLIVVCSSYSSALSVSFFQAREREQWHRFRRLGQPCSITVEHLMASVAIPYLFPAVLVGDEYYADGAVRQAKPLSPCLHLGAQRLLVIGVRDEKPNTLDESALDYPGLGRVAGYLLDTLFMDGLFNDIDHMLHVNQLLEECESVGHEQIRSEDKRVACHVIVPSEDIREIALRHRDRLPRSVRMLLAGGGEKKSGSQLASYLLFDGHYTKDLIDLGYADALRDKDNLMQFFFADEIPDLTAPDHIKKSLLSND